MKKEPVNTNQEDVLADSANQWEARHRRRYGSLIARHLPSWAPEPLAQAFRHALADLHTARLPVRSPNTFGRYLPGDNPCHASHDQDALSRCVATADRIKRYCTYTPEMQRAWRTISTTPVVNKSMSRWIHDSDDTIGLVVHMLEDVVERFERLPKRTPAARKTSLLSVVKATEELIRALNIDPEARAFAHDALADYFGMKNVEMRLKHGDKPCFSHMYFPRFAIDPPYIKRKDGRRERPKCRDRDRLEKMAWGRWTSAERYAWINDEVQHTRLSNLLEHCRDMLSAMAEAPPPIAQPGRPDEGFLPFLIRELSRITRMLYGKPLDDTVALLVSAVANLPAPLSRDDIRPYLRATGKKSPRV